MNSERIFYTYELAYPQSMGGTVFYVGKGSYSQEGRIDRIDMHEREAKRGGTSRKCQIIRDIWANDEQIVRRKVYETPAEQDALIYEWILISLVYGRDTLANMTSEGYVIKHRWYSAHRTD